MMKIDFKFLVIVFLCFVGISNTQAQNTPPAPQNIKVERFQREIELKWRNSEIAQVEWEIVVNTNTPLITKESRIILTNLKPNTEYTIKIRAKKGNSYSAYVTVPNTKTQALEYRVDDIQRIPYLRVLASRGNQYGGVPQKIALFYNELGVDNAKFTYWVDDKKVEPQGNYLMLPPKGRHILKITIKETPERIWNLTYQVRVAY